MTKYVAFLRGINVGGKNKVPMSDLKKTFESLGFQNVKTLLNSGNVIFEAGPSTDKVSKLIKTALEKNFKLPAGPIKVLVMTYDQLKTIAKKAPLGFGQTPAKYYSDVVFLIDVTSGEAFNVFEPNPEVDSVWPGTGVI
ncbi:MAG TPA: DUF1697 domain-containing protein, partial [Xanthomonadales bacterium]|nr:DUF1697 domain-containing protein [Xanthomonadales bacterium]